jgi:tetratricopeptide (TPR) repeat protein
MTVNIPTADITKLDFPVPPELHEANSLLAIGKAEEAAAKAEPIVAQFSPFKSIQGSHYPAASMVALEALARKNDRPGFDKLRGQLKILNLNSVDSARLAAIDATQDFLKGVVGPALSTVDKTIPTINDSSVLAKLYLLRGDIQFKRGNYSESLEAYLHVPVFFGTEQAYLPNAELGAARTLQKLGRIEDSLAMYKGISERYKDEPQGRQARQEMESVAKALGESPTDEEAQDKKAGEENKPEESKKESPEK